MKCNCKEDLEKKLTNHFIERMPDSKDVSAHLTGYGMFLTDNAMVYQPMMTVEVRHTDTSKKSGIEKRKKTKSNLKFSFCPFCGANLQAREV